MALEVFAHGRPGRIIFTDESPDGTLVVLVCEEFDPADPKGITALPNDEADKPDESDEEKKEEEESPPWLRPLGKPRRKKKKKPTVWPTQRAMVRLARQGPEPPQVRDEPFELEIDTTRMPGGVAPFAEREFLDRAADLADEGRTDLTPDNADEWGYRGEARRRAW